jgi:hypothetical protein
VALNFLFRWTVYPESVATKRRPRLRARLLEIATGRVRYVPWDLPLERIDATRFKMHMDDVRLNEAERGVIGNPPWMDEDDADAIVSMRIPADEERSEIPFRQYLREQGLRVVRDARTGRSRIARRAAK